MGACRPGGSRPARLSLRVPAREALPGTSEARHARINFFRVYLTDARVTSASRGLARRFGEQRAEARGYRPAKGEWDRERDRDRGRDRDRDGERHRERDRDREWRNDRGQPSRDRGPPPPPTVKVRGQMHAAPSFKNAFLA